MAGIATDFGMLNSCCGVVINRFSFYKKNKRDVVLFIPRLQKELVKNNLDGAQNLAVQCGGVIGEVTEEAVRIFSEQKNGFSVHLTLQLHLHQENLKVI